MLREERQCQRPAIHLAAAVGPDSIVSRAFRQYRAAHPVRPADRRIEIMPKLTDTQSVLLLAAAARPDLAVLPPPKVLKAKGAALERTLEALRRRGLSPRPPATNARRPEAPPRPEMTIAGAAG
jgi:hypothetical protein